MYSQLIQKFVEEESLPANYAEDAKHYFVPLANHIAIQIFGSDDTLVFGVNGAQGTGKTTLAKLLVKLLNIHQLRIANLSIDDFYLTKSEREELSINLHPLLQTRGVPGTHDTSLLLKKITELKSLKADQFCEIPRFNKATDDRFKELGWQQISGPVDAIILEGWCVGAPPQEPEDLEIAVNSLEASQDPDGSWRRYINTQLAGQYQQVFAQIAELIMLKPPSFAQIFQWRALQEEKLGKVSTIKASNVMNEESLNRFIQHYERLTRHCLKNLPSQASVLYELDSDHRIDNVSGLKC